MITAHTPTTAGHDIVSTTVERFLSSIAAGSGIPADLYEPDASLDATVPNWRLTRRDGAAIAGEYTTWFAHPGVFDELARWPIEGGEVVTYLLTWTEDGVPHAAHHCHVLLVGQDGRITSDTVFCGGRWPAALLAEMARAGE